MIVKFFAIDLRAREYSLRRENGLLRLARLTAMIDHMKQVPVQPNGTLRVP